MLRITRLPFVTLHRAVLRNNSDAIPINRDCRRRRCRSINIRRRWVVRAISSRRIWPRRIPVVAYAGPKPESHSRQVMTPGNTGKVSWEMSKWPAVFTLVRARTSCQPFSLFRWESTHDSNSLACKKPLSFTRRRAWSRSRSARRGPDSRGNCAPRHVRLLPLRPVVTDYSTDT